MDCSGEAEMFILFPVFALQRTEYKRLEIAVFTVSFIVNMRSSAFAQLGIQSGLKLVIVVKGNDKFILGL